MLLRTRDKKWLKRGAIYLSFVALMSVSLFYWFEIPKPVHWTLIVPWALTTVFFIAWRWTARHKPKDKKDAPTGRRKIKRY